MSSSMTPFTDVESNGNKSRTPSSKPKKEKHLIAAVVILAIVLVAFIIAVIILALKASKSHTSDEICSSEGCLNAALDLVKAMNTSVDPCDDFFEYACGNWHAVYSGQAENKLGEQQVKSMLRFHDYVTQALVDEDIPDSVRTVAVAYSICGKYDHIRPEDELWLLQILQEVGGWPLTDRNWDENRYHWEKNLAQAFHKLNIDTPFGFTVDMNLYDTRHYILQMLLHSVSETSPLNKEQILFIARKIGDREDDPSLEKEFDKVAEFEENLRKMTPSIHDVGENPKETKVMTIRDLTTAIPWVNWLEFLRTIFGPYLTTSINESEPVLMMGFSYISKVLESVFKGDISKRTLANYIGATFIRSLIEVNNRIVPESLLRPPKTSLEIIKKFSIPEGFSQSCLMLISMKVGPAVDYLNYKSRKFVTLAGEMLPYYFSSMKDMIGSADWLDEKTRTAAYEKLETMKYYSGFSEVVKDMKLLNEFLLEFPNITRNALRNQLLIQRFRFLKTVQNLRKPVDKNRWPKMEGTHSSQVNAFYVPEYNGIVIPADIQVEQVISPKRPNYWNFAGFGWVLGHEITHGFDTSGSKRDKNGNLKNWWMPQAKEHFDERAKCLVEQYGKIPYGYENHYVNGTLTLAENVADNGGVRQTFAAYQKWVKEHGKEKVLPGFEKFTIEQLFFLAICQLYCPTITTPENVYNAHVNDVHSPTSFRTNPALANFEEFAKAYNCKSGTRMNPVKKCVVW